MKTIIRQKRTEITWYKVKCSCTISISTRDEGFDCPICEEPVQITKAFSLAHWVDDNDDVVSELERF